MAEVGKRSFSRSILDAIPSPVFVVDEDVCILDFNDAALPLLGGQPASALHRRGGEALRCVNATDVPAGCGRAPHCRDCVVRNSVSESFQGRRVVRRATHMQLVGPAGAKDVYILVTTAPLAYEGEPFVVLILEDIGELLELRRLLPICASCKKIRDDAGYWHQVEAYITEHTDAEFTHGLCPDCLKKLYPEFYTAE
jgi:PAS domain-containing protein